MSKLKKIAITVLSIVATFSATMLVACGKSESGNVTDLSQIESIYNLYVASAEANNETPLSYEEWLASIKGEKGDKGDDGQNGKDGANGKDGVTPTITISEDGFWVINGTKTEYLAIGQDGAQGEKGDKGDKGDTGAQGEKGDKGDKGDTGAQGEKGDKGDKGDTGAQGEKGDKGDKGDTGAQGEKGDKGDKGDTGSQGEKGDKGDKGDTGAQGEKGDKGDKGDTGAQGEKGDKGDKGDTGAQGEKGDKGDKGDTGAQGEIGKSAFEIYKEKYGYSNSEEDWLYDLVNGNLAIKATYTVSFDVDGGTEVENQEIIDGKKAVKPADPEKDGCVFRGWFIGDEQWNFLSCMVTEDTVLKAKWIEIEYETTAGDKDDIEVESENNEITLTATHKAGYTWLGWYDGDEKVSKGNSYTVTFNQSESNRVYTAKFAKVTVKQNVAGAGNITELNGKYFFGNNATLTATVNSGYVFAGWYKNGEKVSLDGELSYDIVFGAENETYTATYISNPITISKNLSAAGTITKENTGVIGGDYTITAVTNSGYTWLGWYNGETKVSVGESLTYTFVLTETPVSYMAKWAEYTISLNKNYTKAGTLTGNGRTVAGTNATVKAVNDYSDYFTFDGWYKGTEKVSSTLTYTFEMPSNNISLTAKWNLKDGVQAITTGSELNTINGTQKYILLNDINLSGISFTSKEISSSGVLDGLGYKIKNFACPADGLISTNNGTVKNLIIDTLTSSGRINAPFIYTNNGTVKNCGVNYNTVLATSGFILANNGNIINCYSKLEGVTSITSDYPPYASAFVSYNCGTIKNSYATGRVILKSYSYTSVGYVFTKNAQNGIVNNCYCSGGIEIGEARYINCADFYLEGGIGIANCFSINFDNYAALKGGPTKSFYTNSSKTDQGTITDVSNFYKKTFVTNTIGFKEYGKGSVDNDYVWVFEENSLPKLYWE